MGNSVTTWVLIPVLTIVAIAGALMWPAILAGSFRRLLRQWPEARTSFIASGKWITVSRRFGLRWVILFCSAGFAWVLISARLVVIKIIPDTYFGAWLVFGPAIV